MTLLLGLGYSVAIGVSDFFGAFATRRSQALTVVCSAMLVGAVTAALMLLVVESEFIWVDFWLGALSGLFVGFALVTMYRGMAESSAAVVSPIVAVLAVVIPISYDLATGASLPWLVAVGVAVGVGGLGLATISPELGDRVRTGVLWAVMGGGLFGVTLIVLSYTSPESGLWGAFSQRFVAFIVVGVVAVSRGQRPFVMPVHAKYVIASGLAGGLGISAFVSGVQRGSLSEIAVAGAMFPAVTAILSAVFDNHPLRWWQLLGIGICVAGLALIGLG